MGKHLDLAQERRMDSCVILGTTVPYCPPNIIERELPFVDCAIRMPTNPEIYGFCHMRLRGLGIQWRLDPIQNRKGVETDLMITIRKSSRVCVACYLSVLYGHKITVVLCGDPALFELGAPLRTFYECSLYWRVYPYLTEEWFLSYIPIQI